MTRPLQIGSKYGYALTISASYLVIIGLLIQFSIHTTNRVSPVKPMTQLLAVGLGVALLLVIVRTPLTLWRRAAPYGYVLAIIFLIAVRMYGPIVFGARRWLLVGGLQLQPSELMKPLLAFIGAGLFIHKSKWAHSREVIQSLVLVAVPVVLLLMQPDLSTALMLIIIWVAQLLASPLKVKTVGLILGVAGLMAVLSLPLLNDYQHGRVRNFLNARTNTSETNYNVVQSRVAIGAGGLTGRGLGGGTQSQLSFLPSQQTDFVYAVVAEKLGFLGAMSVLIAELAVSLAAWQIATKAVNSFSALLGAGLAVALSVQGVVNIAMTVGLLPVTGLPLPFVSYGGTSMIVCLASIGWLLVIDASTTKAKKHVEPFTYRSTSVNLDKS